jgi:hypothetical protein
MTLFDARPPTRSRVWLAYSIAAAVDVLQLALGPAGWTFADEALDVAATIALSAMLGFHPAFLPTFVIELLPIVDWFPTWTGCVALVIALRRRNQPVRTPPPSPRGPIIDV